MAHCMCAMADEAVLLGPSTGARQLPEYRGVIEAARKEAAPRPSIRAMAFCRRMRISPKRASMRGWFLSADGRDDARDGVEIRLQPLMEKAGVPLVPGYHGEAQDDATLAEAAGKIGFPVLVKASAGGGGRGMRIVAYGEELAASVESAKREAQGGFRRRSHADREAR